MIENQIKAEYQRVFEHCKVSKTPKHVYDVSESFVNGLWEGYLKGVVKRIPKDLKDAVVVDYGCKYGHIFPLLISLRVKKVIGIEVEEEYINAGKELFGSIYKNVDIAKSENGYISLQPETVDVVIMNEVISHVNPAYLDTVYAEISRVLKKGGMLFVSDGNNLGYNGYFEKKLIPFYDAWENGPDGTKTDRDVVTKCYLNRRIEIIKTRHPDMKEEKVNYLAKNTSGLFGDYLISIIDRYARTGELVCRPYRKGICPTNPGYSGVLIEKGFYPSQVKMQLEGYGFECRFFKNRPALKRINPLGFAKDIYHILRYYLKTASSPNWELSSLEGFQIIAVKKF